MAPQHARPRHLRRRTGAALLAVSGAVLAQWAVVLAVPTRAAPPEELAATSAVATAVGSVLGLVAPLVGRVPQAGSEPEPEPKPPTPVRTQPPGPEGTRCAAALQDVEAAGLELPARFDFRCPGDTQLYPGGRQHWGVTCSYASLCPGSAYVAVNPDRIGPSDARLRHVVAHEVCHALDVEARRPLREPAADACAANHGFPRV